MCSCRVLKAPGILLRHRQSSPSTLTHCMSNSSSPCTDHAHTTRSPQSKHRCPADLMWIRMEDEQTCAHMPRAAKVNMAQSRMNREMCVHSHHTSGISMPQHMPGLRPSANTFPSSAPAAGLPAIQTRNSALGLWQADNIWGGDRIPEMTSSHGDRDHEALLCHNSSCRKPMLRAASWT